VRERGVFGAIFGILISLGIYFAYDGGRHRGGEPRPPSPTSTGERGALLDGVLHPAPGCCWSSLVVDVFTSATRPPTPATATSTPPTRRSGDTGGASAWAQVARRACSRNPVIMTIAAIEFC
jgi:OPA family glycerol-3-phosphate transporter-like MFS transporter